ncbi:MAG: DoxX family protein [Spirulina sp.]
MNWQRYIPYENLILRIFVGVPLILWGIQKITTPAMADVYVKDFQRLIFIDPHLFLFIAGIPQIILGVAIIYGFYTRYIAAFFMWMGLMTFIVPGFFTIGNPYKFAYGIVMAGCGLSLLIRGADAPSWDAKQRKRQKLREERARLASDEF